MSNDQSNAPYHVYLLRLWRERRSLPERPAVWRFSVENTRTRQRRGFTSLEDLVNFLQTQMAENTGNDIRREEVNNARKGPRGL